MGVNRYGAQGEASWITGTTGVGKSTLAHQLVLARMGVTSDLLGLPVSPGDGRVLYIAADRPAQIRRAFVRTATTYGLDRSFASELLVVWNGPLPFTLNDEPARLAAFAAQWGADTLVIDSLKDIAFDLAGDEGGARANTSLQHVLAGGVELVVLHHDRKATGEARRTTSIDDVYGSRFLTAGAGSVLHLDGRPGDPAVTARHLKQPMADVGPLDLVRAARRGLGAVADRDEPGEN